MKPLPSAKNWRLCRFIALSLSLATLMPSHGLAHAGGSIEHAYYEYLFGIEITVTTGAVWLLGFATALLVGARPNISVAWLLSYLFPGIVLGTIIGTLGWVPPNETAYVVAILVGTLIVFSPKSDKLLLGMIILVTAATMANVMLKGSDWRVIPTFLFLGITTALLLLPVGIFAVIRLAQSQLRFSWMEIAWRAIASWIVAISVLMIVLLFASNA